MFGWVLIGSKTHDLWLLVLIDEGSLFGLSREAFEETLPLVVARVDDDIMSDTFFCQRGIKLNNEYDDELCCCGYWTTKDLFRDKDDSS